MDAIKDSGHQEESSLALLRDISTVGDVDARIATISVELDQIEVQFAQQVALKTDVFFQETAHLQHLMEQTTSCKQALGYLQDELSVLSAEYETEVSNLRRIVQQHQVLVQACCIFTKMMDLVKSQMTIQSLLDTHSFVDALRLINEKMSLLDTDLGQIKVFASLKVELQEMKLALEKMMSANLEI